MSVKEITLASAKLEKQINELHFILFIKIMKEATCSRSYKYGKIEDLYIFACGVKKGVYSHPVNFPSPPMTEEEFDDIVEGYQKKRTNYNNGGKNQKGGYLTARTKLYTSLESIGEYIDKVAKGNPSLIILAGYVPTKTSISSKGIPAIPKPSLKFNGRGSLACSCPAIPAALMYGAILTSIPFKSISVNENGLLVIEPDEYDAIREKHMSFSTSRKKSFTGLKPGQRYYLYYFCLNNKGASNIRNPADMISN